MKKFLYEDKYIFINLLKILQLSLKQKSPLLQNLGGEMSQSSFSGRILFAMSIDEDVDVGVDVDEDEVVVNELREGLFEPTTPQAQGS